MCRSLCASRERYLGRGLGKRSTNSDILRSLGENVDVVVRNPDAIRPWQHVFEPQRGCLILCENLFDEGDRWASAWNFGPVDADAKPVSWIVDQLVARWPAEGRWIADPSSQPHEAHYLKLDCSKARAELGWRPVWDLQQSLEHIVSWHESWLEGGDVLDASHALLDTYISDSLRAS